MVRISLAGRAVALAMVMLLLLGALPLGAAKAAWFVTDPLILDRAGGAWASLDGFLQRQDLRGLTAALAGEPAEAAARLASGTDHEVRQLDLLPADRSETAVVMGAAVPLLPVLLVTDLLGLTHVFPFVSQRR